LNRNCKISIVAQNAVLLVLLLGVFPCNGFSWNMINLNTVNSRVFLKMGDKCYFTFTKWSSVGYDAEYTIENEKIIQLVEKKTDYLHSFKMMLGMSGSDEAKSMFIFQAKCKGKTHLILREMFRGEVRSEKMINVTVR
jgi:hypothetical protein